MRRIDADRLKAEIFKACMDSHFMPTKLLDCDDVTELIDNAPTIEEQPKGKWIETDRFDEIADYMLKCPKCNEDTLSSHGNFCPNCGADMRGEQQ